MLEPKLLQRHARQQRVAMPRVCGDDDQRWVAGVTGHEQSLLIPPWRDRARRPCLPAEPFWRRTLEHEHGHHFDWQGHDRRRTQRFDASCTMTAPWTDATVSLAAAWSLPSERFLGGLRSSEGRPPAGVGDTASVRLARNTPP
jgi:hypothetical protein